MSRQTILVYNFIFLFLMANHCILEKIKYITVERPVVQYCNKKYVSYFNVTARRYLRNDPNYYFSTHFEILIPVDNNMTANLYFYEVSTNTYKKMLFDLHFKLCDLIKDKFFGSFLRKGSLTKCPSPPGKYYVANSTLSINNVPHFLKLNKGRMQINIVYSWTGETISRGYLDVDIKERS